MILESPTDARVQAAVDPTYSALRLSLKPAEHKSAEIIGGHYRTVLVTGLTTVLNAGDAILSLRWTDPLVRCLLHRLHVAGTIVTAFTTAQENSVDLVRINGFTAADTGGTALVLGSACQKGTGMNPSRVADLRVAQAVALGAGTGSAEASALSFAVLPLGNTVGNSAFTSLFDVAPGLECPLTLTALQGLRVRLGLTQGAVGVVRFTFVMDWTEVPVAA
jgi:hypothetical protein